MSDGDALKPRPLGDGACLLCGKPAPPGARVCAACDAKTEALKPPLPGPGVLPAAPSASTATPGLKRCPFCAEEIQAAAIVCRFCNRSVDPHRPAQPPAVVAPAAGPSPGVAAVLSLIIPGAGQMYAGRIGWGLGWLVSVVVLYIVVFPLGAVLHIVCIFAAASSARGGSKTSNNYSSTDVNLPFGVEVGCPSCAKTVTVGESITCPHCSVRLPWPLGK